MYVLLLIIISLISLFTLYIVFPSVVKIFLRKKFLFELQKNNSIYLTFDDGPHPYATPAILKLLTEFGVKATFFIIGKNALKYPQLVSDIIKEGHEIGEHSFSHKHPWKSDPLSSIIDIIRNNKAFKKMKISSASIRPPHGKLNLVTLIHAVISKKKIVFWNIDSKDYCSESSTIVAENVINRLKQNNVILLHDGRKSAKLSDANITIDAVRLILENSMKNNIKFYTIKGV